MEETVTGHRLAPVPLGGDPDAVAAAIVYPEKGEPLRLSGCWASIEPDWARVVLERSSSKMPVDEKIIDQMAGDMTARSWLPTGEAIVLDAEGRLVNGRKRLMACIKADMPFVSLLLVGVDPSSIETSDNLRGRRLADILHIQGEANYRALGTMLQVLWRMRNGGFDAKGPLGSDQQLLSMLERMPEMRDSLRYANQRGRYIRLWLFASLHFLLRRVDEEKADAFFKAMLEDGVAIATERADKRLRVGHPVRTLNDLIIHARTSGQDLDRNRMVGAAVIIQCWNAFRSGVPVTNLAWSPKDGTGNVTVFPKISGWDQDKHALVPETLLTSYQLGAHQQESVGGAPSASPLRETEVPAGSPVSAAFGLDFAWAAHPRSEEVWQLAFPDGIVPRVSLRMIGRERAAKLLERNTANRGVVLPIEERYARDQANGEFRSLNGQSVKVADTGRLLDAQHRMGAIVRSGVCLPFVVVEGLSERVFAEMDRAETRSFKMLLAERGVANAGTVAAAAKLQYYYEQSRFERVVGVSPSNPELSSVLARHPGIEVSGGGRPTDGGKIWNNDKDARRLLVPATICWLQYRFQLVDPDQMMAFFHKLATGEMLERGNPILVLRNKLLELATDRQKARSGVAGAKAGAAVGGTEHQIRQAALTILAWNAWVQGKSITAKALVWNEAKKEGGSRDLFPEVLDPEADGRKAPAVPAARTRRKSVARVSGHA